eukprot:845164_1
MIQSIIGIVLLQQKLRVFTKFLGDAKYVLVNYSPCTSNRPRPYIIVQSISTYERVINRLGSLRTQLTASSFARYAAHETLKTCQQMNAADEQTINLNITTFTISNTSLYSRSPATNTINKWTMIQHNFNYHMSPIEQ